MNVVLVLSLLDSFVKCILNMVSSFTQMLLGIYCPDMLKLIWCGGTLTRTHSLFFLAILPFAFLINNYFSFLTICWFRWRFDSHYSPHIMARFSFSVKMECSCLLLPYLISFQDGIILINSLASSPKYNATVLVAILYGFFLCWWGFFLLCFGVFFPLAAWPVVYFHEWTLVWWFASALLCSC